MVEITVELGSRSYPIVIGPGLLATIGERVKTLRPTRIVIVTNTTVAPLYLAAVETSCQSVAPVSSVVLPDGESYKTFTAVQQVLDGWWPRGLTGSLSSSRSEAGWSETFPGSPRQSGCAGSVSCRCRQRSSLRWTVRWAERPVSISRPGKPGIAASISSAVFADTETLETLPRARFRPGSVKS